MSTLFTAWTIYIVDTREVPTMRLVLLTPACVTMHWTRQFGNSVSHPAKKSVNHYNPCARTGR